MTIRVPRPQAALNQKDQEIGCSKQTHIFNSAPNNWPLCLDKIHWQEAKQLVSWLKEKTFDKQVRKGE